MLRTMKVSLLLARVRGVACMIKKGQSTNLQVLTDHKGWPVAVSEGPVWWMVAEVEPAERSQEVAPSVMTPEESFRLQLTNGQTLIAVHDSDQRRWTITHSDHCAGDSSRP